MQVISAISRERRSKMSKLRFGKGLPLYAIISAVLIIAGIVVYAIFGFNYVSAEYKTVEIGYDAIVTIQDKEEDLESLCERSFAAQGLKFCEKRLSVQRDTTSIGETGDKLLSYTFSADTDANKLKSAVDAIRSGTDGTYGDADIYVTVHMNGSAKFYEATWRGAIALAVAAIVVLVYIGFRYGFASALAGLVACIDDALLSVALLALTRLPIYAYMPLLFASLGMIFSLILWIAQCAKMRQNPKSSSNAGITAAEAVGESCRASWKFVLLFAAIFAVGLVILGAVAMSGTRMFMLPALIPLAVGIYSSLLLTPAVLVPLKAKFDRLKETRKRYAGKKKANAEE